MNTMQMCMCKHSCTSPLLVFTLLPLSLAACSAHRGAAFMPLKRRSRWFGGQFRTMVPFSTNSSLQLLSTSAMKILLAYPHAAPPCHLPAPIRNPEAEALFKSPS